MGFKRNHSISYLINHIAVCRTAATLPVLLKYITTVCSGTYKADSASSWELSGCQTDEVKCMSIGLESAHYRQHHSIRYN